MNISKFLILVAFLLQISFNYAFPEENQNKETEEKAISIDDEELPAIDPFQSSSGVSGSSGQIELDPKLGFLNGLKLVGTVIGNSKKMAVLSSSDGIAQNFEEEEDIINGTTIVEIFSDHLLIKDLNNKFYEVYMNNIIKETDQR